MRVTVEAEPRFWAYVPAEFPSGTFLDRDAWLDDIVARYRSAAGDVAADELVAIRSIADTALDELAPGAAFGLLFLPQQAPFAALVHIEVGAPGAGGGDLSTTLLGDIPLLRRPEFEPVTVPGIGSGVSARFLVAQTDAPYETGPAAAIGYIVQGDRCAIRVTTSPTTTTMVGLIDGPLRAVVATLGIEE